MIQRKFIATMFFILYWCVAFAETSYQGLEPGRSTRTDAQRILGPAVRDVGDTLSEHNAPDGPGKVYVQYAKTSPVIERIEVLLTEPRKRDEVIGSLRLSSIPTFKKTNVRGKLEEYFGEEKWIVLTHQSSDESSGINRIGYYSSELFASIEGKPDTVSNANKPAPPQKPSTRQPPPAVVNTPPDNKEPAQTSQGGSVSIRPRPQPQPKAGSRASTISKLSVNESEEMVEFVFHVSDFAAPGKDERIAVPIKISCEGGGGIEFTWSAESIDVQNLDHIVHVSVYKELFPSGQGNQCDVSIRLQDQNGNTSNELKTQIKF